MNTIQLFKPFVYKSQREINGNTFYRLDIMMVVPYGYKAAAKPQSLEDGGPIIIRIEANNIISDNGGTMQVISFPYLPRHFNWETREEFSVDLIVCIDHATYFGLPYEFITRFDMSSTMRRLIDMIRGFQLTKQSNSIENITDSVENITEYVNALLNDEKIDSEYAEEIKRILRTEVSEHAPIGEGQIDIALPSLVDHWEKKIKYILSRIKVTIESKGDDSEIIE